MIASPGLALKQADPTCAGMFAELHRACFDKPWDAAAMADMLAMPGAFGLLAVETCDGESTPVGFVLVRAAAGEAEILSLAVVPAARRRRIARELLEAAFAAARAAGASNMFLEVAESNAAARRLYEQAGFETVGYRPGYYSGGGEDACAMRRPLT